MEPFSLIYLKVSVVKTLLDSADYLANPVRSLPACQMHVGYSGNVCELSVSVLRYWRQLGVQPVGGRKDISVLVVCDPSEGDVRAARAFLRRTVETYEVGFRVVASVDV